MNVPILDLTRVHRRIAPKLEERWRRVFADTSFILGPEVREFEAAFARYLGVKACTGLANGTDALVLALRAVGLRPGDEVIVPAFSFFATAEAVILLGGVPVFADVDRETLNLDPADAARRVTERTVGLIPVHLYGRPIDVDATLALCEKRGLWMIEDAAQAQGASWKGKRVGGFGRLAAWSFYPTKNLGCFGDGGAVTGNDKDLVARVHLLGNHGQTSRYHHVDIGTNSRLDSLQAAVLNCRLELLEEDNTRRRELACRYHGAFAGVGDVRLIPDPSGSAVGLPPVHDPHLPPRRADGAPQVAGSGLGDPLPFAAPSSAGFGREDPRETRRPPRRHRCGERGALPAHLPRAHERRARAGLPGSTQLLRGLETVRL